jgi:predicted transcriptional regulator
MRKMLLSFKADVYKRIITGEKIYEHRKVFPNEPVLAYLYVSKPIKAVTGIMYLDHKVNIETWKEKYAYDKDAVERINKYLKYHKVAMEIVYFQTTNMITLDQLRKDIPGFVVPQMYYYLENHPLLDYLEENLVPEGDMIHHEFDNIPSDAICVH